MRGQPMRTREAPPGALGSSKNSYLASDDLDCIRTARRRRLDANLPAPVGGGDCGRGILTDLDAYFVAGLRPSPDGVRLASLEHHVIAEDRADEGERTGVRGRRTKRRTA